MSGDFDRREYDTRERHDGIHDRKDDWLVIGPDHDLAARDERTTTPRARHEDLPVPQGPPGGNLDGVPGDARFPPRRGPSPLRSDPSTWLRVALSLVEGRGRGPTRCRLRIAT